MSCHVVQAMSYHAGWLLMYTRAIATPGPARTLGGLGLGLLKRVEGGHIPQAGAGALGGRVIKRAAAAHNRHGQGGP